MFFQLQNVVVRDEEFTDPRVILRIVKFCSVPIDIEIVTYSVRRNEPLDVGIRVENDPATGDILNLKFDGFAFEDLSLFEFGS